MLFFLRILDSLYPDIPEVLQIAPEGNEGIDITVHGKPQYNASMRRPLVRFINDVKPISNLKIAHFQHSSARITKYVIIKNYLLMISKDTSPAELPDKVFQ